MKCTENTEFEVMEMLNRYAQAYADKNINNMMALFLEDPNIVAIGTGTDEWVHGYSELKKGFERDFAQADNIQVKFEKVTIQSANSAAWLSGLMTMYATVSGKEVLLSGRLSMVLERIGDKWLFTHLHFSLPAGEQEEGHSFPEWIIS
ncbi:nuclear transport factor 2 family protein [Methanobacterium sp.]|uniref:nuclear transport factor 2 family protein n=1 Tax=Methanobacterium sp. TaxID=2164 RepID=UPI003C77FA1C